jgi:polyhydroxyalkanoate synthesis regulator phasin
MTMPTKKKTATRNVRGTGEVLREAWGTTQRALVSAEAQMEKQVKALLKKNEIGPREAKEALRKLGARLEKGRRKALKQVEARLSTLQARIHKERLVAGRMVDDAVKAALATFNVPSRKEVAELTRKVDELSRKIDGLKRRR